MNQRTHSTERIEIPLDHNFPEPILNLLDAYMPDVALIPIRKIHRRLPELNDRELILTLKKLGYGALITNNYKMLRNPHELEAVIHTKLNVIAIAGVGHDPLRATGGILVDLPTIVRKIDNTKPQVFFIRPRGPKPQDAFDLMKDVAAHLETSPQHLRQEVRVTPEEADADYLA